MLFFIRTGFVFLLLIVSMHCIEDPGHNDPLTVQLPIEWQQVIDGDIDVHTIGESQGQASIFAVPQTVESWVIEQTTVNRRVQAPNSCAASNGGGIQKMLISIKNVLPLSDFENIIRQAIATDPEIQSLKQIILSPEFRWNVEEIRKSSQMTILRDYACQKLYFDVKFNADYVKNLFEMQLDAYQPLDAVKFTKLRLGAARPGIIGTLNDIIDILPIEEISKIIKDQIATDIDLHETLFAMNSEEFGQILANIAELKSYQALIKMFDSLPIQNIVDVVKFSLNLLEPQMLT